MTAKGLPRGRPAGAEFLRVAGQRVQGLACSGIHKIITGPQMAAAWAQENRVAHACAR
jgi:hypothetical protein